jgi:hypothetical protein
MAEDFVAVLTSSTREGEIFCKKGSSLFFRLPRIIHDNLYVSLKVTKYLHLTECRHNSVSKTVYSIKQIFISYCINF